METSDNASVTKDKSNLQYVEKIPPMISPINTPQKNKPENKSPTEGINKHYETKSSTDRKDMKWLFVE